MEKNSIKLIIWGYRESRVGGQESRVRGSRVESQGVKSPGVESLGV
jgi:hypothetical protein